MRLSARAPEQLQSLGFTLLGRGEPTEKGLVGATSLGNPTVSSASVPRVGTRSGHGAAALALQCRWVGVREDRLVWHR